MDDWDDLIDSMRRAPRVAKQTHFAFVPDETPPKDQPAIDATLALLSATPLTIPEVAARHHPPRRILHRHGTRHGWRNCDCWSAAQSAGLDNQTGLSVCESA